MCHAAERTGFGPSGNGNLTRRVPSKNCPCQPRQSALHASTRPPRRGAGVVERGGLENRCGCKPTQGSNPCLSATGPCKTLQGQRNFAVGRSNFSQTVALPCAEGGGRRDGRAALGTLEPPSALLSRCAGRKRGVRDFNQWLTDVANWQQSCDLCPDVEHLRPRSVSFIENRPRLPPDITYCLARVQRQQCGPPKWPDAATPHLREVTSCLTPVQA